MLAATIAAGLLLGVSAATVLAAGTPAERCQQGKNVASGKYAACLAKAEKAFVLSGSEPDRLAERAECEEAFAKRWQKLESSALAAGGACTTTNDRSSVSNYVASCSDTISEGVSGVVYPWGPEWCPLVLESCVFSRNECELALQECLSGPAGCDASLARCEALTCDGVPDGIATLKTGQATSFGPGTDGDTQLGTARSFTDNGDGTITDDVTGLVWEKKGDSGDIHDKDQLYQYCGSTLYEESCYYDAPVMNGTVVTDFLATMNAGSGFAGHTDWRLPTRLELETLLNLDVYDPATYPVFATGCTPGCSSISCSCTASADYLSSTTFPTEEGYASSVDFLGGVGAGVNKAYPTAVRAVRGGN